VVLSEEDISAASLMPEVDQIVIVVSRFTPCLSNENQKTKRVRKDTPGVQAMISNNCYGKLATSNLMNASTWAKSYDDKGIMNVVYKVGDTLFLSTRTLLPRVGAKSFCMFGSNSYIT
jgi:hypothetical protein